VRAKLIARSFDKWRLPSAKHAGSVPLQAPSARAFCAGRVVRGAKPRRIRGFKVDCRFPRMLLTRLARIKRWPGRELLSMPTSFRIMLAARESVRFGRATCIPT
jgi:hypothetical protein